MFQSQLVQMAFAGPDLEQEFADLKSANARDEAGTAQERAKIEQDGKDIYTIMNEIICMLIPGIVLL